MMMMRTVHRTKNKCLSIFFHSREHVLLVVIPVTRCLIQINCSNTRCHNMLIAKLSFLILDVDFGDHAFKEEDLAAIEKEMKKIAKRGFKIIRKEISKEEALEMFKDDEYKHDLISNLEDGNIHVMSREILQIFAADLMLTM